MVHDLLLHDDRRIRGEPPHLPRSTPISTPSSHTTDGGLGLNKRVYLSHVVIVLDVGCQTGWTMDPDPEPHNDDRHEGGSSSSKKSSGKRKASFSGDSPSPGAVGGSPSNAFTIPKRQKGVVFLW